MIAHPTLNKAKKLVAYMVFFVGISGCVSNDFEDLTEYVDQIKAKPATVIDPMPVVKFYELYTYVAAGLRNPFQKEDKANLRNEMVEAEGPGPDLDREKEALEAYPLDTLRMVGTLSRNGELWGLVQAGDGVIHRVKSGHYVGQNFGKIMDMQEQQIDLNEWVTTAEGRWVEREAFLALVE